MARLAHKVDANQHTICNFLRSFPGVAYYVTSGLGKGFPDIVVSYQGVNDLWELKDGEKPPSAQKLTPQEWEFHEKWKGSIAIVRSVDEARERLEKIRKGVVSDDDFEGCDETEICPICNGEGYIQKTIGAGGFNCWRCKGSGEVSDS